MSRISRNRQTDLGQSTPSVKFRGDRIVISAERLAAMGKKLPPDMTEPTFSADGVDLFLGDSAIIAPTLEQTFDLLATDPPYGVGFRSNRREATEKFEIMHGDQGEVDVPAILRACVLKLRPFRHAYVFGPETLVAGIERLTDPVTLIWDKENIGMGDLSLPRGPSHEPINFSVHVPSKANKIRGDGRLAARLRQGSILRALRPNASGVKRHPSEKPVEVMRQIIESSSCANEIVFDPFMGSGSTVVAALLEGRRVVGIEKDEKYFTIARQRVEALLPLLRQLGGA
jgi:DNA modification methylase